MALIVPQIKMRLLRATSIASYINLYQQEKVTKVAVNEKNKTNRQNGKLVFKFLRNKVLKMLLIQFLP